MLDALFYTVLAVVGSMPVFLLVAAVSGADLATARSRTLRFLEEWGGVAPERLADWVKFTFGSTVGVALLVALAYSFNLAGDRSLPAISALFGHFGVEHTRWSVEQEGDWKHLRNHVKIRWHELHPEEDLKSDPVAWEKWKNDRGKWQVRAARTLVVYAFLVCLAGVVDSVRKRFRRRGLVCLLAGLLASVTFTLIWADRKAHYVEAVIVANTTLGDRGAPIPESLPLP